MVWPFVDPLPIEQGKTREQKGVTEMYEPRRNAATLLDAQLRFAEMVVDACAQGAKMYWAIWGPMGEMAIDAVEALESTQHRYLEQLRDAVEDGNAVRS
jgi:hypothetical protein